MANNQGFEAPTPSPAPRQLPAPVAGILLRARTAENTATGTGRRRAWQLTRELIQASLSAGYSAALIAAALEVTSGSIRNRAGTSGYLDAAELLELADIEAGVLETWQRDGLLPHTRRDSLDRPMYAAEDIILGLARHGATLGGATTHD